MNINVTGKHVELDSELEGYATKKASKIARLIPRKNRDGVNVHIILSEDRGKKSDRYSAEFIVSGGVNVTAKESTVSLTAAIDIAEAKIRRQLRREKTKRTDGRRGFRRK